MKIMSASTKIHPIVLFSLGVVVGVLLIRPLFAGSQGQCVVEVTAPTQSVEKDVPPIPVIAVTTPAEPPLPRPEDRPALPPPLPSPVAVVEDPTPKVVTWYTQRPTISKCFPSPGGLFNALRGMINGVSPTKDSPRSALQLRTKLYQQRGLPPPASIAVADNTMESVCYDIAADIPTQDELPELRKLYDAAANVPANAHGGTVEGDLLVYNVHTNVREPVVAYIFEHTSDLRSLDAVNYSSIISGSGSGKRPVWWVEVGSFRGGSAQRIVEHARAKQNLKPGEFVLQCIDPWTGDVNMWHQFRSFIDPHEGRPQLFEHFVHTIAVKAPHLAQYVVPQVTTSLVGLKSLKRHFELKKAFPEGLRPNVIYVDSAHEESETFMELSIAYELLPVGGWLAGDDFVPYWTGVWKDVNRFARQLPCAEPVGGTTAPLPAFCTEFPHSPLLDEPITCATLEPGLGRVVRVLPGCQWVLRKLS